jgi:hypothetical protein
VLIAFGTAGASASALTFDFTGQVYAVSASISNVFSVGDHVAGSYTFESNSAGVTHPIGSVSPSPSAGTVTSFDGALTAFEIGIGSYRLELSGPNRIVITKDERDAPLALLVDRYIIELLGPTGANVNGLPTSDMFLDWEAPAPTTLAAGALPITPLFEAFPISAGALDFVDGQIALNRVTFAIDSVTLASVPEPSSTFLCCLGLAGIGILRQRRIATAKRFEWASIRPLSGPTAAAAAGRPRATA